MSCCAESENEDLRVAVNMAFLPVTEMKFFLREVNAERIVEDKACFSLSCGMLVYSVLKSYVETECTLLDLLHCLMKAVTGLRLSMTKHLLV